MLVTRSLILASLYFDKCMFCVLMRRSKFQDCTKGQWLNIKWYIADYTYETCTFHLFPFGCCIKLVIMVCIYRNSFNDIDEQEHFGISDSAQNPCPMLRLTLLSRNSWTCSKSMFAVERSQYFIDMAFINRWSLIL